MAQILSSCKWMIYECQRGLHFLDDHVEQTPPTTEQSETEADLSVTKEKIEVKIFV